MDGQLLWAWASKTRAAVRVDSRDSILLLLLPVQVDGKTIKAQIWDTAGQVRHLA